MSQTPEQIDPEQIEPEQIDPEQIDPQQVDPEQGDKKRVDSLKPPTHDGRPVPDAVAVLFWDAPERPLELGRYRALLVRRVLNEGSWEACRWLRSTLGGQAIAQELRRVSGRGIDRRSLRLWQVLLELSEAEVDEWLAVPERRIWDQRTS